MDNGSGRSVLASAAERAAYLRAAQERVRLLSAAQRRDLDYRYERTKQDGQASSGMRKT